MNALVRERKIFRPGQLNALARDLLESSFAQIWVEGEISNWARPASGHAYFTLKDDRAQVRCALFKQNAQRLSFQPKDGLLVLARGRVTLYEARGDYQLVLEHLELAGEGALRLALETLKNKLAAEGLFDTGRKHALPRFVRRLGIITSPTGAAIRDVLSVFARRFPLVAIDILPVPVQGDGAAKQILTMLQSAITSKRYDALLITRGGGSLEDLWAFNDEALARAVAASPIPIVSAVGHEIDTSLCDYAADLRAATPSAAAELLVPEQSTLQAQLQQQSRQITQAWQRLLRNAQQRCDLLTLRLQAAKPSLRLERGRQRLVQLNQRQQWLIEQKLQQRRAQLAALARTLGSISPLSTLGRGYALLHTESGELVRRTEQVTRGDQITAQLANDRLLLRVE